MSYQKAAPITLKRKRKFVTEGDSVEGLCLLCENKKETSRWTHITTEGVRINVDLCIGCWKNQCTADYTHTKRLLSLALSKVKDNAVSEEAT